MLRFWINLGIFFLSFHSHSPLCSFKVEKKSTLNFPQNQNKAIFRTPLKGNVDDRNIEVFNVLSNKLFGSLYADKGYISKNLFSKLFYDGIHLVTGIKNNMKNQLMTMKDKILLRKRSVIETINDQLKNMCQIEHSRHRGKINFLINLISGIAAYCFFEKKPAIKYEVEETYGQLALDF